MKVSELIEELKELDQDAPVKVRNREGDFDVSEFIVQLEHEGNYVLIGS